tara:strand:- start:42 stop:296 length:255 start_codon:yes stop_codon:yes gene_type:complete
MYKYVNGQQVALTQAEIDDFNNGNDPELANLIRVERNGLLAATDWWVLPDRVATQEQLDYRAALRNITDQDGFPDNVIWPTKPE